MTETGGIATRTRAFVDALEPAERLAIINERDAMQTSGVYGERTRAVASKFALGIFGADFGRMTHLTDWMDHLYVAVLRFYAEPAIGAHRKAMAEIPTESGPEER